MQTAPAAPSLKSLALDASASRTYYSIAEVAALLGVSRVSVWRWISSGRLPVTRLGHRTVRVKREDIALVARPSRGGLPVQPNAVDATPPVDGVQTGAADHFVMFYDADQFLVDGVAEFLGPGLGAGDRAIVVATPAHRASIADRLRAAGFDLHRAIADGSFVSIDAADTLARFMVDGRPDPARFGQVLGGLLRGLPATTSRPRIFGEMVALLTADRRPAEALALEAMWNQQATRRSFALMCAYPMPRMVGESVSSVLADVCAEHSTVIPTESYAVLGNSAARLRAIAALQQQAASLQSEVAERRRAEQELQRALAAEQCARAEAEAALRVRDEFLSIASHELRTPITILGAQAQLSLRRFERTGELDPERTAQALRSMGTQADKLGRLVGQLLDVARLDGGKLELDLQPTNLLRLAEQVVAAARSLLTTGSHTIALTAPAAVDCEVDPLRIEQVLTNLIDNAIKYSPLGGEIDVTVSLPSPEIVELSVRDHGLGIPVEKRGQIFERFYQAHDTSFRSGMGLGLYVSRQIVERHGGEISAEFPADGGTRLIVRLPSGRSSVRASAAAD